LLIVRFPGCGLRELSEGDAGVCDADGLGHNGELPDGALGSVMQTIVFSESLISFSHYIYNMI